MFLSSNSYASRALFYTRRLSILIFGLFLCSAGIVCTYRSNLGLGPWDVLHQGISRHTPFTFGQASIIVGGIIILVGFILKVRPGVGTVLNMLLIGVFVDFLLHLNWIPEMGQTFLVLRLVLDVWGLFLMGLGTAFYITPRLGAGPRDGLMLRLNVLTKLRIALVRAIIELSALLIGFYLGGTVGIGTLIFALGIGPSVEIGFWLVKKLEVMLGLKPLTAAPAQEHTKAPDSIPHHPELHPVDRHSW